jgi:hypothetical protein
MYVSGFGSMVLILYLTLAIGAISYIECIVIIDSWTYIHTVDFYNRCPRVFNLYCSIPTWRSDDSAASSVNSWYKTHSVEGRKGSPKRLGLGLSAA